MRAWERTGRALKHRSAHRLEWLSRRQSTYFWQQSDVFLYESEVIFFFCLFMTDDTTSPAAVHDRRADWVVLLVSASALMCLACQRRGSLLILSKSWVCVFCIRPASVCVCQSGGLSRLCERGSKSPCNYNLNSPDILPSLPRCVCVLCVLVCVYIRVRAEGLLSCGAETAGCSSLINEKPHNYR